MTYEDNGSGWGSILGALISNNNNGGWGGNLLWIIILGFFFLIGGGNGFFGNRGGGFPPDVATKDDVYAATAWSSTQSKIDNQTQQINALGLQGLSSASAINQNVSQQGADTRLQICQSKGEVTSGIAALGYAVNNGQQQIERSIDQVRYDNAQNTCNITTTDTANTQKVLDKLCQMEANMQATRINELTVTNQALTLQNAMNQQTAAIVGAVRPYPQPSYIVSSPYQSVWGYGGFGPGFGYGNFT